MFQWKIEMQVEECSGIMINPHAEYSVILRFDNKFSMPSQVAKISGSKLSFGCFISLQFSSASSELPSSNLQILMVMLESQERDGNNPKKQQIIGIATIKVSYPFPEELKGSQIFRFDKSLDSKATVKGELAMSREINEPKRRQNPRKASLDSKMPRDSILKTQEKQCLSELLSLQQQKTGEYKKYVQFLQKQLGQLSNCQENEEEEKNKPDYEALLKERNELYKLSEDLYEELKKCMKERDDNLKELRERMLSQEQIREEFEFLKLKIEQYQQGHNGAQLAQNTDLLGEIEYLKNENESLKSDAEEKQKKMRQLERKVKECFKAIDEFKNEALQARSELIHKQSELSLIHKQSKSKYLDPEDTMCIEELYKELEYRRNDLNFDFSTIHHVKKQLDFFKLIADIRKDVALLFVRLLGKMKQPREKQMLMKEKVEFEGKLQLKFLPFIGHKP